MNKISLAIILLVAAILVSCEKDEDLELNYEITGEWSWVKSYGGITGGALYTPENTGKEKTLIFMDNDSVYVIENSDTIQRADYFLSREESILLQEEFDFVTINYKFNITNPDSVITLPMRYIIRTLNDTLVLDEDVYDGFGHQYLRAHNH